MPRHEETISLNGMNTETVLALAYQAMKNLQWEIVLSGKDTLLGHTPKSWKSKGQQINCTVTHSSMSVISETVNRELTNMSEIHQSNTRIFLEAFEDAKTSTNEHTLLANLHAIYELRNVTQQAIAKQKEKFEELDKAMNLTGSNLYATYSIIGINLLVFLLMVIDGAGLFEPNGIVHLKWGSNYAPFTLSGDWWRLITNTFIHFGIIHIVMNMYCLYSIATYLEPMLGKQKYIAAYLCTGVIASLVSLWWHTDAANSAGASGAVFGLYGLFLAFLTTSYIPSSIRQSLLRSIGIFVLFNLAYGLKSGVDNAAHIGGLISGFLIGFGYVYAIKKEKELGQKTPLLLLIIVLLTTGITAVFLKQNEANDSIRVAMQKELKESSYKDFQKFEQRLRDFERVNNSALEIINDTTLNGSERVDQITYQLMPKWEQATTLITATKIYDISPSAHKKAEHLLNYLKLRKRESELLIEMTTLNSPYKIIQLKGIRQDAVLMFDKISKE